MIMSSSSTMNAAASLQRSKQACVSYCLMPVWIARRYHRGRWKDERGLEGASDTLAGLRACSRSEAFGSKQSAVARIHDKVKTLLGCRKKDDCDQNQRPPQHLQQHTRRGASRSEMDHFAECGYRKLQGKLAAKVVTWVTKIPAHRAHHPNGIPRK